MVWRRPVHSDTLVCDGMTKRHVMPLGLGDEGKDIVAITA
jgi:hypothetical protein